MTCTMASCGHCGMCTEPWEADDDRDPFTCIVCDVECELDNFEPFYSTKCKDNYDGPPDGEAWSGGIAGNH